MADATTLLLASGSPRRRELLDQLGVAHRVVAAQVDERALEGESPTALVVRLARLKAQAGLAQEPAASALGADTVVVIDGEILGKPRDAADAARMLQLLSGRTHEVHSGVAVAQGRSVATRLSSTAVTFRPLEPDEIAAYWSSGEPRDKAGGYAVQGRAARFITRIEGSYSGVMGLPLYETAELLASVGLLPPLGAAS